MALPASKPVTLVGAFRRHSSYKEISTPNWQPYHYVIATIASVLFWLFMGAFSDSTIATSLGVLVIGGVVLLSPFLFARRQLIAGLTVLAYLAAVQPAIRAYIPALRYNILEYTITLSVFFILTQRRKLLLSIPTFFYLLYLGLELIGIVNAERFDIMRGVFLSSFTLFLILLISDQIKLLPEHLDCLWQGYLVGSVSILFLLARILFSDEVITWTTASNLQISAGMGPNQISFLLSIAIFICLVLGDKASSQGRWVYRLLAGVLAYFMILTFSRGGLYIVSGAILLYYLFLQRPNWNTLPVLAVFGILVYVGITIASDTTQGTVLARYSELDTSNRLLLAQQGWRIFLDSPVLGVGTGNYHVAIATDEYFGSLSGAHNELIRAAAEHGVFGLSFWILFAISSVIVVLRSPKDQTKALRLTLLFIAFISFFYNGLKLIIQPLLIFMAFTLVSPEPATTETNLQPDRYGVAADLNRTSPARLQVTRKAIQQNRNKKSSTDPSTHDPQ